MNKAKLKAYAPQARKDFIAAVTARAQRLGLSEANGQFVVDPAVLAGDLVIIAGQSWPAKISSQRDKLIELINQDGYQQTLEAVAYIWFNRFAALRYMEIHDYLNHGYRVLSSREGGLPEILNAATDLAQNGELPSLNAQKVKELKLAGDQDGELYRLTLIAQCNALSSAIPFLFERIDDETELLLPDNLLLTDSVVAKLVSAIPEEDWSQVEIIGWLYQFYISEKKDQVIGKVVKSEDIPAATQLFTPNWIVQYLVQNSIGRLWLMANPASTLKSQWPYYIEPAEQTPEVQIQLDALIQTRMAEDGGSLNPETLTVLDPACGSGHILVEAYEVLKAIYLERGYQARSIPRLILEKNLFGLDIDDRAAQLAGFALLMKARADDRRLFDKPPKLNVLALQDSKGLDANELAQALKTTRAETFDGTQDRPVEAHFITHLINTFAQAKAFGSLIQIPQELNKKLAAMEKALQQALRSEDLFTQAAAFNLLPLVQQAKILGMKFDAVVANPPYMGSHAINEKLKELISRDFPTGKYNTFAAFTLRCSHLCNPIGTAALITLQGWMFQERYSLMRSGFLRNNTLWTMAHLGARAFTEITGEVVQTTAFAYSPAHVAEYIPVFIPAYDGEEEQKISLIKSKEQFVRDIPTDEFLLMPGNSILYWASDKIRGLFKDSKTLGSILATREGMATADNNRFLRLWWEVSFDRIYFNSSSQAETKINGKMWFPYIKGGEFRKWFGNLELIVNWENDGAEIRSIMNPLTNKIRSHNYNGEYAFREGLSWTSISSNSIASRYTPKGFMFDAKGPMGFCKTKNELLQSLGLINSVVGFNFMSLIAPSLDFKLGHLGSIHLLILNR